MRLRPTDIKATLQTLFRPPQPTNRARRLPSHSATEEKDKINRIWGFNCLEESRSALWKKTP